MSEELDPHLVPLELKNGMHICNTQVHTTQTTRRFSDLKIDLINLQRAKRPASATCFLEDRTKTGKGSDGKTRTILRTRDWLAPRLQTSCS